MYHCHVTMVSIEDDWRNIARERCSATGTLREAGVRQWWSNVHLEQTSTHNAIDVKQASNYYAASEPIIIVKTGIFIVMGIISLGPN